jgi:hypothetical protein
VCVVRISVVACWLVTEFVIYDLRIALYLRCRHLFRTSGEANRKS